MKKLILISILAMITMIFLISGCTDPYNPPDPEEITITYDATDLKEGDGFEVTFSKIPDSFSIFMGDNIDAYISGSGNEYRIIPYTKDFSGLNGTYQAKIEILKNGKVYENYQNLNFSQDKQTIRILSDIIETNEIEGGSNGNKIITGYNKISNNGEAYLVIAPTTNISEYKLETDISKLFIAKKIAFTNGVAQINDLKGIPVTEGISFIVVNGDKDGKSNRMKFISGTGTYEVPIFINSQQTSAVGHTAYFNQEEEVAVSYFSTTPDVMNEFLGENFKGIEEIVINENNYNVSGNFPEFFSQYREKLTELFGESVNIKVTNEEEKVGKNKIIITFEDFPNAIYGLYGPLFYPNSPFLWGGSVNLNINRYNKDYPATIEALLHHALVEAFNAGTAPTTEFYGHLITPFCFPMHQSQYYDITKIQPADEIFLEALKLWPMSFGLCPALANDPNISPNIDWEQNGLNIGEAYLFMKKNDLPNWAGSDVGFLVKDNYTDSYSVFASEFFWNLVDQKIEQFIDNQNSKLPPKGE